MNISDLPKHHAILITHNNRKTFADAFWNKLQAQSLAHRFFETTVLDIDTARTIISWAKSSYDDDRIGLLSFHTISIPAQNALLKILEEPNEKTRFILVTSNKENLISTVLSRIHHYEQADALYDNSLDAARLFLATKPTERMKSEFIISLLNSTDEEGRKDRESVRTFILSVVDVCGTEPTLVRYVQEILEIASFASEPSASGKALIEYTALLLPQLTD